MLVFTIHASRYIVNDVVKPSSGNMYFSLFFINQLLKFKNIYIYSFIEVTNTN